MWKRQTWLSSSGCWSFAPARWIFTSPLLPFAPPVLEDPPPVEPAVVVPPLFPCPFELSPPLFPCPVELPVDEPVDVDVDVPVEPPLVPQLMVKSANRSPPELGVRCQTCSVYCPLASIESVALVQLPCEFALHVLLAFTVALCLISHEPVPLESQPVPLIWKVQMLLPLPVSLTTVAAAFCHAQAGLAPAVARNSRERLMRIVKYPAALRIDASLPFLRWARCPRQAQGQGSLHYFVAT